MIFHYFRKLQEYLECIEILDACENDSLKVQEKQLLRDMILNSDLKESWEFCQNQVYDSLDEKHIHKRSPVAKKRGGGSSRSRSSSRGRISSSIRKAITGSKGAKGQKVLKTLFGSKKGKIGNVGKVANKSVKQRGGFLRKAGKYAVVGLAGS